MAHDPDVFFNESAIELKPLAFTGKPLSAKGALSEGETRRRRKIAGEVFSGIDWEDDVTGFCDCPGANLHTVKNNSQVLVKIDGAPTASCLHNSCGHFVESLNYELRSKIG